MFHTTMRPTIAERSFIPHYNRRVSSSGFAACVASRADGNNERVEKNHLIVFTNDKSDDKEHEETAGFSLNKQ